MASGMQRVEFKTQDGTVLRGNFTPPSNAKAGTKAPAVIFISGLTFLKEHGGTEEAKGFNKAGYATLFFDHRHWGSSDGLPRQHVNLYQEGEDLSDAITYMSNRPDIDANRIAIWGIGHGGGVVCHTGAYDKRAKAVIAMGPFFSGEVDLRRFKPEVLERAWKERADRISKPNKEHEYVPIFASSREEAEKDPTASVIGSPIGFDLWTNFKPLSDAAGTPWENKITLESHYWQSKWEPTVAIHLISPRPLYFIAVDTPLLPEYKEQVKVFERALEPKQFFGFKNLEESATGPLWEKTLQSQVDFLKKYV